MCIYRIYIFIYINKNVNVCYEPIISCFIALIGLKISESILFEFWRVFIYLLVIICLFFQYLDNEYIKKTPEFEWYKTGDYQLVTNIYIFICIDYPMIRKLNILEI